MFLRKWEAGRLAISALVAAFLVLSGLNLTGLAIGEEALNEAKARYFVYISVVEVKGTYSDEKNKCEGPPYNCEKTVVIIIIAGATFMLTDEGLVPVD